MPLDKLRLGACFVVYGSHGHAQVHSYRTGPDLNISYGCVCSRRCGRSRKAWRWCSVKALSRVRITRSIPYAPRIKYDCHIVSCQSGPSAQMNVEQRALQHFAHEVLPGEYYKVKRKHCTLKRSKKTWLLQCVSSWGKHEKKGIRACTAVPKLCMASPDRRVAQNW